MKRLALALALAAPVQAPAQSADVLLNCTACHSLSPEPDSPPSPYPDLAGQPTRYLERQLNAYRTGLRQHRQMQQTATALGAGAAAMARMYGEAPMKQLTQIRTPPPDAARLAENGDWERGLPSCNSCHGTAAADEPRIAPRLHGHPPAYLERQLRAYADGSRQSGPMGRMRAFSQRLTDGEIVTLSQYYAAWRPDPVQPQEAPDG